MRLPDWLIRRLDSKDHERLDSLVDTFVKLGLSVQLIGGEIKITIIRKR